jgi:hypothetical protein
VESAAAYELTGKEEDVKIDPETVMRGVVVADLLDEDDEDEPAAPPEPQPQPPPRQVAIASGQPVEPWLKNLVRAILLVGLAGTLFVIVSVAYWVIRVLVQGHSQPN